MKNWKYYYITYTTFDNKTRRLKGTLCSEDEKVIDKSTDIKDKTSFLVFFILLSPYKSFY